MSIEKNLERCAEALEFIAKSISSAMEQELKEKKKQPGAKGPGSKKRATKKEEGVATTKEDFISDAEPVETEPFLSEDEVRYYVRMYAVKFGREKAEILMRSHGADKAKPKIVDIPKDKYTSLVDEIKKALNIKE